MKILSVLVKIFYKNYWYDYVKVKKGKVAKLCYMDINSFISHVLSEDIYPKIAEDVKKILNISN